MRPPFEILLPDPLGGESAVVLAGPQEDWPDEAFEDELALVAGAAECRRREFAAARGLAHEAMRRLGLPPRPVLRAEDGRAPRWPEGMTGALSHASGRGKTIGWAAAAVGRAGAVKGIGIDLEWADRVRERLWKRVFNDKEREALEALPEDGWRTLAAGIGFAAKEAFYKLFHPLTGRWADFHDATVAAREDGSFTLACAPELPGIPPVLEGCWTQPAPGLVLCVVALRGNHPSLPAGLPPSCAAP